MSQLAVLRPSIRLPKYQNIRLPRPVRKLYILPKKRGRAVTISLGIRTRDGVVLCSDQQITALGFHKYYEVKFRELKGNGWGIVFNYADPDMMNLLFQTVEDHFPIFSIPTAADAKTTLAEIVDGLHREHKDFRIQSLQLCSGSPDLAG